MARGRRLTFGCVLACIGTTAAALVVALGPHFFPSRPNPAAPPGEGPELVGQIEAYRSAHGAYPADLATAGIASPPNPAGEWRYSPSVNLDRFGLLAWRRNDGRYVVSYAPERGWMWEPSATGSD